MAQCKQTPAEFIKNAFTPQVAVMCSAAAEQICQKNNLSFIELLQPFLILNGDVHYKDPSGTTVTVHNLKITLSDVSFRPPQPTLARKLLNASVSEFTEPRLQTISINEYVLNMPVSAPWFEAWRETFLKVQFPSDHEFTKHFLACILVVSSGENNPVEALVQLAQNLNQLQNNPSNKLPKWFSSNILRYCVVVHDNTEGNLSVATQSMDTIKDSYGVSNCFLLRMNSRPPGQIKEQLPDPWSQFLTHHFDYDVKTQENFSNGSQSSTDYESDVNVPVSLNFHPLSPDTEEQPVKYSNVEKSVKEKSCVLHGACLTTDDVEQIKFLIHEFCTRSLLPYVEKQIHQITDSVSNKKGVSRSIFSATKRWFTPNKPGTNVQGVINLIYSPDSLELQMRKLGDLYFMFGHYNLAFQAYHSAKRDFNADQAWLYYAGALEMAALAAFMSNESTRKTFDYMEESITTYLNTCKVAQFATRATLLSSECLKGRCFYGEAAHQLIRMTSEESDLRSAVLLEQAAYCFLQNTKPIMVRKYAFHMVLAGHRFSKAAQRKHSLRSYKQAFQIYQNRSWNLAEDHIHFTIGRQAAHLLQYKEAIASFEKLLTGESGQTPIQQAAFLKEYISIHSLMEEPSEGIQTLPLPVLLSEKIKILVEPTPPLKTPGKVPAVGVNFSNNNDVVSQNRWQKLEELLVQEAEGSPPMIFKPLITLYTTENLAQSKPTAVINEPIQVSISLHNSLHITMNLKDIYLLWTFKNDKTVLCNDVFSKNIETYMKTHVIKSAVVQPNCTQELVLSVTPLVVGSLQLKGVFYKLTNAGAPEEVVTTSGKQMFDVRVLNKNKNIDGKDRKFEITLVPAAPCMHVTFSELPSELFCNEIRRVSVDLRNVGTIPLRNVYMATTTPHLISNYEFYREHRDSINSEPMKKNTFSIPLPNNKLESGQCCSLNLWVKAPEFKGPTVIDLLIYYENESTKSTPRYRLVKHIWQLSVLESISVDVAFQSSTTAKSMEHLALAVNVTNLNNVHHAVLTEISLLKAAFLSRHWTLCDDFISPKNLKLKSQDIGHVVFKAKRKQLDDSSEYSEVMLCDKKTLPDVNAEIYLDFASRFKFYNNTQEEYVEDNMEAILILQWRASVIEENKNREIYGQCHIPVCKLNKDKNEFLDNTQSNFFELKISDTVNKNDNNTTTNKILTYNLLHPPKVLHDFKRNKICVVPVKLILYSRDKADILIVTVNTLGTSSTSSLHLHRPNICYPFSSRHFKWIGPSSTVHRVKPLSSKCLKLSVAVMGPGTYDVGARIEVACKKIDHPDDPVLQTCRVQSAILVINCDS